MYYLLTRVSGVMRANFHLARLYRSFQSVVLWLSYLRSLFRSNSQESRSHSMNRRQNTKQKAREYPSNQHEIKTFEAIATAFLILDSLALKTLQYEGDTEDAEKFEKLTKDYVDRIENDPLRNLRFTLRVSRFVSDLKLSDLLDLISRPVRTTYYWDAIYLRVNACYEAKDEEDSRYFTDDPPSDEEYAKKELRAIVEEVQKLDRHVRDADDKRYAGEKILQLKAMLGKLDGALAIACEYLGDEHKPLANWDTTDQQ